MKSFERKFEDVRCNSLGGFIDLLLRQTWLKENWKTIKGNVPLTWCTKREFILEILPGGPSSLDISLPFLNAII